MINKIIFGQYFRLMKAFITPVHYLLKKNPIEYLKFASNYRNENTMHDSVKLIHFYLLETRH